MPALGKTQHWFSDFIGLQPVTERRTRNRKVAHLFIGYSNGAVSGYPQSFCGLIQEQGWRVAEDSGLPLCNHCGRAFREEQHEWFGQP